MRRIVLVCLAAIALVIPLESASAQNVLPTSIGDWTAAQPVAAPSTTLTGQVPTEDAYIFKEYGFKSIERQEYASGRETLKAILFQMEDPTAAYGAFTFLRRPNMPASKLTQYAVVSPDRALIVVGNFLLDVYGKRLTKSTGALESLIASVKPKADPRPYPNIADHLPIEGLVPSSELYAIGPRALDGALPVGSGDWIGFSQGAEAILARYRKGGQEVTVLVAEYPTQQIAAKRFDAMKPLVHPDPPTPENVNRVVGSLREGDLIVLAFAPRSGAFPDGLLREVSFGHNVTSNEGKHTATDKSMPTYIIGAFVGAGAIMLIAIISGLGFGLVRIVVKKFFPGKVFDRRKDMEVIQLGLSDRPVNMKDFY